MFLHERRQRLDKLQMHEDTRNPAIQIRLS
jgi:hypothetical protein